jgi:hypothetical protein
VRTEIVVNTIFVGLILILAIYGVLLFMAFVYPLNLETFRTTVESNLRLNIGVPFAAVGAFGIVAALWRLFPPGEGAAGEIRIEFFSLTFSGPSGPITLWVICFLCFVFALKLLLMTADTTPLGQ